jgi:hypothetical protein
MMDKLIYKPPLTTRIKLSITFPWMAKEWKVKEISLKDYKHHFRDATEMTNEEN